ncbi:unnamed protein product, partial [Sphacelaria rigidula]
PQILRGWRVVSEQLIEISHGSSSREIASGVPSLQSILAALVVSRVQLIDWGAYSADGRTHGQSAHRHEPFPLDANDRVTGVKNIGECHLGVDKGADELENT